MDVIGLLFDYIFRDPSIPESLRSLFSRLQVPILKTALLDRTFFSNKKHPARRLLDHLAAASIGATGDAGYCAAFELIAAGLIEEICRDFKVDMAVFEDADGRLQEFVDAEQRKVSAALDTEVVQALSAEKNESDRAHVRVLIRDKLAGLDVPFDVRAFSETVWADYLTEVRAKQGAGSTEWTAAVQTLDDLLWSITAKERTAQKARLAKLVPSMIRNLRAGAAAVKVADRPRPAVSRRDLQVAHGGDQARSRSMPASQASHRQSRTKEAGHRHDDACSRQRARLRQRDGGRHVARIRQGRQDDQRPPVVGQPAAQQVHLHQPRAQQGHRGDAGGACLAARRGQGKPGRRAGAACSIARSAPRSIHLAAKSRPAAAGRRLTRANSIAHGRPRLRPASRTPRRSARNRSAPIAC